MIVKIFTNLSSALESSPHIVLACCFVWGILSIILSPCHLSSIPLIVGFMSGQGNKPELKKAFVISSLFSIGIMISIALVGLITGLFGRLLGDIGIIGNSVMSLLFILIGLYMMGIMNIPFINKTQQSGIQRRGFLGAFILGLVFGIAIGPCTFAYMAPMLGIVFKTASSNLFYSLSLITAYAVGHCMIIIIAGSSFELTNKYLKLNDGSRVITILKKVCGVLVILTGIYMAKDILQIFI